MFGQRRPRALGHRPSLQQGGARGPSSPDTEGLVGGSGPTQGHPETAVSPALVPPLGLTSLTPSDEAGLLQFAKRKDALPAGSGLPGAQWGWPSPALGQVCAFWNSTADGRAQARTGRAGPLARRPRVGPAARVAGPPPCEALPVRPPAHGCPQPGLTMKEDGALKKQTTTRSKHCEHRSFLMPKPHSESLAVSAGQVGTRA